MALLLLWENIKRFGRSGLITAVVRLDDTDCNTTPEVKGGAKKYLSQKEGEIELANCLIFAIW